MVYENIYNKLNSFCKNNRVPHTIFYGSPSSRKEDILLYFLKMIYGTHTNFREEVMFVNCAHGKGIKFTRDEIKFFAKTNAKRGVSFKSVVLLNADHLTVDAQSALRRCIEQYSNNTRFFIVVENKNKLLLPILSRFCEIYVPDTQEKTYTNDRSELLDTHLEQYTCRSQCSDHKQMISTVHTLYEEAFSCIDIISWLQNRDEWTEMEKANIGMCFYKMKPEYRCEKLLMLILLSLMLHETNIDLSKISFL